MGSGDRHPDDVRQDQDAVNAPHDTDGNKVIPGQINPNGQD